MISRVLCETLTLRDLDGGIAAWVDELGWEVVADLQVTEALVDFWGGSTADHPRLALVASTRKDGGFIRLVEGPEDDTGDSFHRAGLFNAELLCRDVDELHRRLRTSERFRPLCEPTTYDLSSTGGATSRSFATRGPGGAGVFFTTYLSVPSPRVLPRCEPLVCGMFNSALALDDRAEMESFYEGILGMKRRLEGRLASPPINRILGLEDEASFFMVVYKGEGEGLIEVDVHEGRLPRIGKAPGRLAPGNAFLTLESPELEEIAARAKAAGRLKAGPIRLELPPYHGRRAILIEDSVDQRIEVIEGGAAGA